MRLTIEVQASGVTVLRLALSKRNLLSLLAKLDIDGSARTIYKDFPQDASVPVTHRVLVTSEPDADAYADAPAGPMHPVTEVMILSPRDSGGS